MTYPDFWQRGFIFFTEEIMDMDGADYTRNQDYENLRVYRDFSPKDLGKSRKLVAVFQNAEDAERCAEAVNATTWQEITPYWRRSITENEMPIQMWSPGFVEPRVVYSKDDTYFKSATHWAPMLKPPKIVKG